MTDGRDKAYEPSSVKAYELPDVNINRDTLLRVVYNRGCLRCNVVEHAMVAVGTVIVLCTACAEKWFPDGSFDRGSDEFKSMTSEYKEKAEKESL